MKKPNVKTLLSMLTYCRPHGGVYVSKFASKFLASPDRIDALGSGSKTLFVAHMDSVHQTDGIQEITYDENLNIVYKANGSKECLGADDASGVWLLTELMKAGVPGVYVFTIGEERGGIGAKHLAKDTKFLARFDRAIAFDRKANESIITQQGCGRCCSDEFAIELGIGLGMNHVPDDTGVYTDTAEFTRVIPECTNISVGYLNEHTPYEVQDVDYLLALRKACIELDWESLPVYRDPKEEESWKSSKHYDLEFTIVERNEEFRLYDEDGVYIASHESVLFLEGYATAIADMESFQAVIQYEVGDQNYDSKALRKDDPDLYDTPTFGLDTESYERWVRGL